jgi:hypothetical protein
MTRNRVDVVWQYTDESPTYGEQFVLQDERLPTAWIATSTPVDVRR